MILSEWSSHKEQLPAGQIPTSPVSCRQALYSSNDDIGLPSKFGWYMSDLICTVLSCCVQHATPQVLHTLAFTKTKQSTSWKQRWSRSNHNTSASICHASILCATLPERARERCYHLGLEIPVQVGPTGVGAPFSRYRMVCLRCASYKIAKPNAHRRLNRIVPVPGSAQIRSHQFDRNGLFRNDGA